jgi:hypothetical protein
VIAEGIKKPVATDFVVVCCYYDLALYMATKRNAMHATFTFNQVKTKVGISVCSQLQCLADSSLMRKESTRREKCSKRKMLGK